MTLSRDGGGTPEASRNASTGHSFSSTLCPMICGNWEMTCASCFFCAPRASRQPTIGSSFSSRPSTSNCGKRSNTTGSFLLATPSPSRNSQFGRTRSVTLAPRSRRHLLCILSMDTSSRPLERRNVAASAACSAPATGPAAIAAEVSRIQPLSCAPPHLLLLRNRSKTLTEFLPLPSATRDADALASPSRGSAILHPALSRAASVSIGSETGSACPFGLPRGFATLYAG